MYLASLFSLVDMIDLHILIYLKDRFCHDEAHIDQYEHFHIFKLEHELGWSLTCGMVCSNFEPKHVQHKPKYCIHMQCKKKSDYATVPGG